MQNQPLQVKRKWPLAHCSFKFVFWLLGAKFERSSQDCCCSTLSLWSWANNQTTNQHVNAVNRDARHLILVARGYNLRRRPSSCPWPLPGFSYSSSCTHVPQLHRPYPFPSHIPPYYSHAAGPVGVPRWPGRCVFLLPAL